MSRWAVSRSQNIVRSLITDVQRHRATSDLRDPKTSSIATVYMNEDKATMRPDLSDDVKMSKAANTPIFTFEDLRVSILSTRLDSC
jgi:hypothetical protein